MVLSLTNKRRPKLTVDGFSYLLQGVNKQGVEQWRCITYWKTKCKGRLSRAGLMCIQRARHCETCDQRPHAGLQTSQSEVITKVATEPTAVGPTTESSVAVAGDFPPVSFPS